jgi:DNA-binding LacI/PurR family transcriptional regulator
MTSTPRKPAETLRLRHLAQATGLSVGTISKVLNGREGVSEENRERVRQAVNELGFARWPTMKPAENVVKAITVITYSVGTYGGTFYENVIKSMIDTGRKRGITIEVNLLMLPLAQPDIADAHLLQNGTPDALILLGVDQRPVLDRMAALGCPTILVNGIDPMMRFDSICPDYYLGGYLATQHLLDQGHRDIVHIGTKRRLTLDLRRQGFVAALAHAGIQYEPARHYIDIGSQIFAMLDDNILDGQIDAAGKLKSTAFFAVADEVAINVMQKLNARGFSVPGDASVIGFDDLSVSAYCIPALTTLHSDLALLGQLAIDTLIERAANPQKHISRFSIGTSLVQRDSTAPL